MAQIPRWCALLLALLLAGRAGAQSLDDVSLVSVGGNAALRVVFTSQVRLAQQPPQGASQLFQYRIEPFGPDDVAALGPAEDARHLLASGALPDLTVTLLPDLGQRGRTLRLQISRPADVRVRPGPNLRTLDLVFVEVVAAAAEEHRLHQRFAIQLESVPESALDSLTPIPAELTRYEVFDTHSVVAGIKRFDVNVGYFASEAEAETMRVALLGRFPRARVIDTASPVAASGALPQKSNDALELQAQALLAKAKSDLTSGRCDGAVDTLNELLKLPPTAEMQDAQELVGAAWECLGDMTRARREYELYLKLYAGSEGAQRVRQHLAALGQPAAAEGTVPRAPVSRYSGNIAQYYLGGKARSQSLVNLSSGIDQATLTKTTESALVTSLDASGRYANASSDFKAVARGTASQNLTSTSKNTSILNALYLDYRHVDSGIAARVGRQSAINGGLIGVFDGLSATAPLPGATRLSLMGGRPSNALVSAPDERLLAALLEADSLADHTSGDLYLIDQTTQGIDNRRAVGAELRYADERGSAYALVDYDALFSAVNALSLQGSFQAPAQSTVTVLVDLRRAPSLELTNALISSGQSSLKALLATKSLAEVRADARATSANARQVLVSLARPLNDKWQFAGDVRYSDIGALPQVGNFQATPATGAQYGLTFQLTGTDLYSKRDINNFNLSLLSTPFFHGLQLAYNNLTGLQENTVTAEPSIRLYMQRDQTGGDLLRISPGLRGTYQLSKRASLTGEGLIEHSTSKSPTGHDTTNSVYFYVGYRYDLF